MAMTLRERTLAAMNHEVPDQVPAFAIAIDNWENYLKSRGIAGDGRDLLASWGFGTNKFPFDFSLLPAWRGPSRKSKDGRPLGSFGTPIFDEFSYNDYWPRPLARVETVAEVEAFDWPDPAHLDFGPMRKALEAESTQLRMENCWQPLFCLVCDMFGMQRALELMYLKPALIEAALAHIDGYYSQYYAREAEVCGGRLDFLAFGDDFADNRSLLMPPELWRKWFKPLFAKYFAFGKGAGMRIWMHACGAIREVLPDLVDIGLDVWETVQAHLPGNEPEGLKRDFGRHLTFAGGVNTQHILWCAKPDEVRRHVRERIRVLGKGGGYLCGPDHVIKPGVPFENITALFETVREFRGEGCTLP